MAEQTNESSLPSSSPQPAASPAAGTPVRTGRWAAWAVSLIAHGGLVAAAFLVTWTVMAVREEPPAPVIVADFESMSFAPLAQLAEAPALAERPLELPPIELPPEPPVPAAAADVGVGAGA